MGAANSARGDCEIGVVSMVYFTLCTALTIGLMWVGTVAVMVVVVDSKAVYSESGGKVFAAAPDDADSVVVTEGTLAVGSPNVG